MVDDGRAKQGAQFCRDWASTYWLKLNAQFGCTRIASSTRLERQINLAIISIKMMVYVVFTDDVSVYWWWFNVVFTDYLGRCFHLHLSVSGQVQQIQGCIVLQIFSEESCILSVLASFKAVLRPFLLGETCEMFSHLVSLNQNNAISSPGLLGCRPYFWQLYRCMTSFSTYRKLLPNLVNACWLWRMSHGIWTNNKSSFAGKTTYTINGVSLSNDFQTKGTLYTSRV